MQTDAGLPSGPLPTMPAAGHTLVDGEHHDVVIVGCGAAGLQLAYYCEHANVDYIIVERASAASGPCPFFRAFPRHRKLISLNKRHNFFTEPDFNMRHDWNSLLTDYDDANDTVRSDDARSAARRPGDNCFDDDAFSFPYRHAQQKHAASSLSSSSMPMPRMTDYSDALFPAADCFVSYCHDFYRHFSLRCAFDTHVAHIRRPRACERGRRHSGASSVLRDDGFVLEYTTTTTTNADNVTAHSATRTLTCNTLFMATGCVGASAPTSAELPGVELCETYEEHDTDQMRFINKRVLVVGQGNSAFETADHISAHAGIVHVALRRPIRHAWDSHFVGDLRALNNNLLDMYQLKSLHATIGDPPTRVRRAPPSPSSSSSSTTPLIVSFHEYLGNIDVAVGEVALEREYDIVILATGVRWVPLHLFDSASSIADNSDSTATRLSPQTHTRQKYPSITSTYESVNTPNLFFVGASMQAIDRKAASGFIHGFRYLVRACFEQLWRAGRVRAKSSPTSLSSALVTSIPRSPSLPHSQYCVDLTPALRDYIRERRGTRDSASLELEAVTTLLLRRLTVVSSLFQCFGVLCDVVTVNRNNAGSNDNESLQYTLHRAVPYKWVCEQLGRMPSPPSSSAAAASSSSAVGADCDCARQQPMQPGTHAQHNGLFAATSTMTSQHHCHVFVVSLQFNFGKYSKHISANDFIQDSGTLTTACGAFLHPVVQHFRNVTTTTAATTATFVEENHLFETLDLRFTTVGGGAGDGRESLSTMNHALLLDVLDHALTLTTSSSPPLAPLRRLTATSTPDAEKAALFAQHMGPACVRVWSAAERQAWKTRVLAERAKEQEQVVCQLFPLPISKL